MTAGVPASGDEVMYRGRDTSALLTLLVTEFILRCLLVLCLKLGYYHSKLKHHFLSIVDILREQLLLN